MLAALECFADTGYHASTTRDIAAKADMSPAALYVHYKSKGELLRILTVIAHTSVLESVKEAVESTTDPAEQLRRYVRAMTAFHAGNTTIARVSQYELRALDADAYREVTALRREMSSLLEDVLARGIEQGEFRAVPTPTLRHAILSLCIDVVRWYVPGRDTPPDELADAYALLALRLVGWQQALDEQAPA